MINRRFLNFKTYNAFKDKLDHSKIRKDSIVFIQDKRCIWARGEEYVCDGPYISDIEDLSLKFKNGDSTVIFSVNISNGTVTFIDKDGNTIQGTFLLLSDLNPVYQEITNARNEFAGNLTTVQNQIEQDLSSIETSIISLLNGKQDKLSAGYGIDPAALSKNIIKSTVDSSIYVIAKELPRITDADPNKIYILERIVDDNYVHEQWRVIDGEWAPIGTAMPNVNYQLYFESVLDNYATIPYVNSTFVKLASVYFPNQPGFSIEDYTDLPDSPTQNTTVTTITVDDELSLISANPVKNYIIKQALDSKADKSVLEELYAKRSDILQKVDRSELNNYATTNDLNTKLDVLTAGRGISIEDSTINCTLEIDNKVYLFVDEFPEEDINPDKIYIKPETDNDETIYVLYRYTNEQWVPIGQLSSDIDLTPYLRSDTASSTYLTKTDAAELYQPAGNYQQSGNYANADYVESTYQKKGDYIDYELFNAFRDSLNNAFLRKGSYVEASSVISALNTLQLIIDEKYVLKKDVYNPNASGWSTSDPTTILVLASAGGLSGSGSGGGNMVTLTVEQYARLVEANLVLPDTYYFTYEGEAETTEWHFGDTFPITFGNSTWGFGDQFPITLTDGSTPDSFGTFPINLT